MFSNYSPQVKVIKWEVIAVLNVAHLFYWNIIFQHNPQALHFSCFGISFKIPLQ